MTVVTTLDITDLTAIEYRAVLDELGVERHPDVGIYLHLATPTDLGFRIVEIWDHEDGFNRFLEDRLAPATRAVGMNRESAISVTPLHNCFAPRLQELAALASSLPGGPNANARAPASAGRPLPRS